MPNLIEVQRNSYKLFLEEGLKETFSEVSPIQDFTGNLVLEFVDYSLGEPKYDVDECKERDATYAAPLRLKVRLINKETGEVKEQEVFMGDFPIMTTKGTFIINGAERVIVSQLVRSPGVYYSETIDQTGKNCTALPLFQIAVPGWSSRPMPMIICLSESTGPENYRRLCCCGHWAIPAMDRFWSCLITMNGFV